MVCKRYEIRRGRILYRDELKFRSLIHELFWKAMMKGKGFHIKEMHNN
jgi:hypothetical protein